MSRTVVKAGFEHIHRIAECMRPADRAECEAGGLNPFTALCDSFSRSAVAWTGLVDAMPICMFGVSPVDILGGVGSPWLLGTDEVEKCTITFLRLNKRYVPKMFELFPRLENYVDARNELSIRWLKWLGFQFDKDPTPYGPWELPFYRFRMESFSLARGDKIDCGASWQA